MGNFEISICVDDFIFCFPVFKDEKTPSPYLEQFLQAPPGHPEATNAAKPDHVYLDAMGFGMGCCCLQLTFQACNIDEARTLYDQLTPLCPIMVQIVNSYCSLRNYNYVFEI